MASDTVTTSQHQRALPGRSRWGFTLLELLVVVAIVGVLMSILATTLGRVREAARAVHCKSKLQTVAQSFQLFADDYGQAERGRESERLGPNRFRMEDFQDSLYQTEEFYRIDPGNLGPRPYDTGAHPLICPDGPRELAREASAQPAEDSITPLENVSVGFNMRLHRASVRVQHGAIEFDVLRDVTLSVRVLDHPWTPLAFDVDGAAGAAAGGSGAAVLFRAADRGDRDVCGREFLVSIQPARGAGACRLPGGARLERPRAGAGRRLGLGLSTARRPVGDFAGPGQDVVTR
jgi:prepilin-type N-terminal cleavage/methylation domain-containing protein